MIEDYGFPTSEAQARMLDTKDPAEFNAARFEDKEAFDQSRSAGTVRRIAGKLVTDPVENYGALQTVQQIALNKAVLQAMGEPTAVSATRQNIGRARKSISDSYNEIAQLAQPIDTVAPLIKLDKLLSESVDDSVTAKLQYYRKQIEDFAEGGKLSPSDLMNIKNRISGEMRKAYGREPNLVLGDALRDIDQILDLALRKNLDAEAVKDLDANRHKWAVANTALRTSAATNARGDVNIRSFINAYRQGNRRYKIGYDQNEFANFLDTAAAVMFKETRDSGTPQALGPLLTEIAAAAGVPGTGLLR